MSPRPRDERIAHHLLRETGADQVFIDTGRIAAQIREVCTGGVDKVLELVGTATLEDSLRCAKPGGIVCMTGMVGNSWSLDGFQPDGRDPHRSLPDDLRRRGSPTSCARRCRNSSSRSRRAALRVQVGRTFRLEEIAEAHRCMEENRAGGKIVVLP